MPSLVSVFDPNSGWLAFCVIVDCFCDNKGEWGLIKLKKVGKSQTFGALLVYHYIRKVQLAVLTVQGMHVNS